ncbi:MAG: hypothetical protein IIA91_07130, partial [Chloroflexi bacterium]|nr:hypothetical protein [Chloroflexota bacterium]
MDGTNARFDSSVTAAFGALSAGTRNIVGCIIYRDKGGTDANDEMVCWIDTGGFNFAANGSTV